MKQFYTLLLTLTFRGAFRFDGKSLVNITKNGPW
jgi:hypothetical protein